MINGILAGITWALETMILGIALDMSPFISTPQAIFLAPFISTFLHDAFSAVFMLLYNIIKGNMRNVVSLFKTPSFKWLLFASCIGGPVGMTGYVLAVNNMGASIGAVVSAIYPAIGTVLAFLFLKERVKWYQWIFLIFTMLGVYGLSDSPSVNIENFWLGLLGALMCAFGWGIEAVVLAKCLKNPEIKNEYALWVRQTTSALLYAIVIIPGLSGWEFTLTLFKGESSILFLTIAIAALCATVSYLFYYKAIAKVGAAKAMALNITYTAWSMIFAVVFLKNTSILNPQTILCATVVVVCGILAATDIKVLLDKCRKR